MSFAALLVSSSGFAATSMLSRGGLGFLFPDHNSFNNASQFALDKGTAIDVTYSTQSQTGGNAQTITPSVVYGGNNFGFGVGVERAGTSLTSSSGNTDVIEGGFGVAMAKQRLTFGVSGSRQLTSPQTSDGTVGGQLTWNGDKRMGFTTGVGVNTTINQAGGDVKSGTAAVGWGFNAMTKVEAVARFNDLSAFSDYSLGAAITMEGQMLYGAGGFTYNMLTKVSSVQGRVGLTFGHWDFSAAVDDTLTSGSSMKFSGQARIMF